MDPSNCFRDKKSPREDAKKDRQTQVLEAKRIKATQTKGEISKSHVALRLKSSLTTQQNKENEDLKIKVKQQRYIDKELQRLNQYTKSFFPI